MTWQWILPPLDVVVKLLTSLNTLLNNTTSNMSLFVRFSIGTEDSLFLKINSRPQLSDATDISWIRAKQNPESTITSIRVFGTPPTERSLDGIHPNSSVGRQRYYSSIRKAIFKTLQKVTLGSVVVSVPHPR